MTLLSPMTALIAAALAVPALLLLYFLKLRRQHHVISSTLLWRRAVHDLQVNAPFQRLRKNLLLLLQLLALAALIFALGQPVANFLRAEGPPVVLMVDQSASMTVREESGPRLDEVKQRAADFIETLGSADRAMIIGFADRARVVCPFTSDKRQLRRQLDALEPTEARSTLSEALQLAAAYGSRIVDAPNATVPVTEAADLRLFSDGRIADADELVVRRDALQFFTAGKAHDNVGIVALEVRRAYESPTQLSVFARIENFGPAAVATDVTLTIDGRIVSVKEVELGRLDPATTRPNTTTRTAGPGSAQNLSFELSHESAAVVELGIARDDAFDVDNKAWAVVMAPRPASVLGVGGRDLVRGFVSRAVGSVAGVSLKWMTPNEYEQASDADLVEAGRCKFDLVIVDRHDTARLPPGNYLFLGGVPKIDGVTTGPDIEDEGVVNWDEAHPLMRYVLFDNVNVARWRRLTVPGRAVPLVEGQTSPVISLLTEPGRQFVMVAFDLLDSDFPLKVPFVLFMQNVVRVMTRGASEAPTTLRCGDTLSTPVPRGATEAEVLRPDGNTDEVDVSERLGLSYGRTGLTGIYRVRFNDDAGTTASFAVNLLDRTESLILPNDRFRVGADTVAGQSTVKRTNNPLWPYAVAAALLVVMLEWWVYNRRVAI